jgi:hypothetical protein
MADSYPNAPGVEFRPIPGFPGYCAGSDGTIWGSKRPNSGEVHSNGWRKMKPFINRQGYLCLSLRVDCKSRPARVNRLVLMAFVGPCPDGYQSCHDNGDRLDNRPGNLRWDTPKANQGDALRHGTRAMGSRQGLAKLTEHDVSVIRSRADHGSRCVDLAREYGMTLQAIRSIVFRRTWRHVG